MNRKKIERLLKEYELAKVKQASILINEINRKFNKSFRDIPSLLKAARLINGRSLDKRTRERISELCDKLFEAISGDLTASVSFAGKASNNFGNALEKEVLAGTKILPSVVMGGGSKTAAEALFKSKTFNENLSNRLWKQNKNYRKRIENVLTDAINTGESARDVSRKLYTAQYKNASGPGIYTDPRKNAERLARTTINQAHQANDHERWKSAWYIKAIEVRLSNNHAIFDVCDQLQGKYPKDFHFSGWHSQCRCHAVPVLASEKERDQYEDYTLGTRKTPPAIKYIDEMPSQFTDWMKKNEKRVAGWKSTPTWIKQNPKYVSK